MREKAYDIHFIDLVFFAGGKEQCCPFRFVRQRGSCRKLDRGRGFLYICRHGLVGGEDEYGCAAGVHPGGSAIAMDKYFFCGGEMVMNDITDIRYVQSPGRKISGDEHIGAAVPEF